jgi:hypothetical protein
VEERQVSERKQPYLTLDETAGELGITRAELDAVVAAGAVKVIRPPNTETVVARWALEAYMRNLRGEAPPITILPLLSDDELLSRFLEQASGMTPREFYLAFERDEIEDTSENMTLLVYAVALGGDKGESTTFDEFMEELRCEAEAEGPEALAEFETLEKIWRNPDSPLGPHALAAARRRARRERDALERGE